LGAWLKCQRTCQVQGAKFNPQYHTRRKGKKYFRYNLKKKEKGVPGFPVT
jgi:hypothetical protein